MTIDAQRHSAEMAAQRAQELAGDDRHYRLRKACAVRAVELHEALNQAMSAIGGVPFLRGHFAHIDQLLKEIEHDAE